MGSGLIYAAIIVMWALYFIPRWLRRHEELSESRSVEKFDHAMRVLSRREPTPDQRFIVMPPKPRPAAAPAESTVAAARRSAARSPLSSQGRSSMGVRRGRALAALVLVTLVVAVATPVSPVPWWAPLLALMVTLADVVHLRVQERRRREVTRTRHAVRKRLRSRLRRVDSAERLTEARAMLAKRRAAAEAQRVEADWAAHEVARSASVSAAGWQPTPVPLPTYVTKPIAPRVGRPIDLTRPGAWTEARQGFATASDVAPGEEIYDQTSAEGRSQGSAAQAGSAQAAPADAFESPAVAAGQPSGSAPTYDDYAAELEEILQRRRAVND